MAYSDFQVTIGTYVVGQVTGAGVRVVMENLTGAKGFTSKPRAIDFEGTAGSYVPAAVQAARVIGVEFKITKDRGSVADIMAEYEAAVAAIGVATPITLTLAYGSATDTYIVGEPSIVEDFSQLHVGIIRCRASFIAGDPVGV
jgi:hypothetical protein